MQIHNFEVFRDNLAVFSSDAHWLHPIFEFETFLQGYDKGAVSELRVHDKIIGRAAALLLVRLGITTLHAYTLSKPGQQVLDHYQTKYSYGVLIDKIACQTEELLIDTLDPEEAHRLIRARIRSRATH